MQALKSLLLTLTMGAIALTSQADLVLRQKNGSEQRFPLESLRKLTFDNGKVNVHTLRAVARFDIGGVQRLTFGNLTTAIAAPTLSAPRLAFEGNKLHATGTAGEVLRVYATDGRLLRQAKLTTGTLQLDTDDLGKGIFVARLGTTSLKFAK